MRHISYEYLHQVDEASLIDLLNGEIVRRHLIQHEMFDSSSIRMWVKSKTEASAAEGCLVRAVLVDDVLAGWCGIQRSADGYELAIVLGKSHWGVGRRVFKELMGWARALGHESVDIRLLFTRPRYAFLSRAAISIFESEWMGGRFTTYRLSTSLSRI